nr:hypothetical protein [Hominibacterium faecale]
MSQDRAGIKEPPSVAHTVTIVPLLQFLKADAFILPEKVPYLVLRDPKIGFVNSIIHKVVLPYVELAYMTGLLPIAKYSSGSELNMFRAGSPKDMSRKSGHPSGILLKSI